MDYITKNKTQGEVANELMSNGLNPNAMRPFVGKDGKSYITVHKGGSKTDPKNWGVINVNTGATLRREEWKQLDEAIVQPARSRLNGIQDLINRGLVHNLNEAMGTTILESHEVSDAFTAELTMDAITRSKGDRVNYSHNYLPIPIIHVDYEINQRTLIASRKMGNSLDTTSAERAARAVSQKLENLLFTNTSYAFGGGTIYSYLSHPDRLTSADTHFDTDSAGGILDTVKGWKQDLIDAKFFGPYVLYLPTRYETTLDDDYDTSGQSTQTIRERLMKLGNIEAIKIVDTLPETAALMVNMTSDTVRLVRGMDIQNIQWATEGGMSNKFKVMTIQVPQIRSDYNDACGVLHATMS